MTTSGQAPWFPRLSEIIDEAFEIGAGMDPAAVSQRHLLSAMRSYNRLIVDLDNDGDVVERDDVQTEIVPANTQMLFTHPDTLSVEQVMLHEGTRRFEISERHFREWFLLTDRDQTGQPTSFAVTHTVPRELFDAQAAANSTFGTQTFSRAFYSGGFIEAKAYDPMRYGPAILLHRIPDKEYTVQYTRTRLTQKGASLNENPDMRRTWANAITLGVAKDLALKYAMGRHETVKREFEAALEKAKSENRSRADLVIRAAAFDLRRGRSRTRTRW